MFPCHAGTQQLALVERRPVHAVRRSRLQDRVSAVSGGTPSQSRSLLHRLRHLQELHPCEQYSGCAAAIAILRPLGRCQALPVPRLRASLAASDSRTVTGNRLALSCVVFSSPSPSFGIARDKKPE